MAHGATFRFGNVKYFEIELNKTNGMYLAGEKIIGHLVVDLKEETAVRDIRVKLKGKAYVQYVLSDTRYWARLIYMDHEASLVKMPQGKSTVNLPAGLHKFPFIFPLHPRLPSSLEGSIGYVKYSVEGVVDKPWHNVNTSRPLTVFSIFDLNKDPRALMPLEKSSETNLCCCCCASGPISATFRLERRGLVPGEAIKFEVNFTNRSNSRIQKSYINLHKVVIFKVKGTFKRDTQKVACLAEGPRIEKGQSFTWENQTLTLPLVPPTSIGVCEAIDVKYFLELNVLVAWEVTLIIQLDIVVGSVPLAHTLPQLMVQALAAQLLGDRNEQAHNESTVPQSNGTVGSITSEQRS